MTFITPPQAVLLGYLSKCDIKYIDEMYLKCINLIKDTNIEKMCDEMIESRKILNKRYERRKDARTDIQW